MDYIYNEIESIFVEVPEQSCYNYTFLNEESVNGTILEKGSYATTQHNGNPILYDSRMNLCRNNNKVSLSALENSGQKTVNDSKDTMTNKNSLLPNPEIGFVEDGQINYQSFQSRDTLFLGGVVPFVAIPDSDLATEDRFFNDQSFSLFLYFKRKF